MSGSYEAVKSSVSRRVAFQRLDLVTKYGIDAVMAAIEEVAEGYSVTELEEIGSSDVSCMVASVEKILQLTAQG